jgi:DNA-binding NarL/FixJ family response regulator
MEKIGVFVVDNSTIFREGLRQSFARIEDIEVVGDSNINGEALELVMSFSPQVVLLDIGLPLLNGLSLIRQITLRSPAIPVIALTPYDNDENFFQAIKSGTAGYLIKNATADELALAIRRVHQGEYIINEMVLTRPKVAERVLKQFQSLSLMGTALERLTAPVTSRELEILDYVAHGYSNKQVAYKLGISEQTIKNHMSSILRKLDANDRTQAVVLAIHYGWIPSQVDELSLAYKRVNAEDCDIP